MGALAGVDLRSSRGRRAGTSGQRVGERRRWARPVGVEAQPCGSNAARAAAMPFGDPRSSDVPTGRREFDERTCKVHICSACPASSSPSRVRSSLATARADGGRGHAPSKLRFVNRTDAHDGERSRRRRRTCGARSTALSDFPERQGLKAQLGSETLACPNDDPLEDARKRRPSDDHARSGSAGAPARRG